MSAITPSSWPWLPTELIENIISKSWSSSLSTDDRIMLMTSSLLVNKTWMAAFTRVSSTDAHIPCLPYVNQYLRMLREESPIYDENVRSLPDRLCRSLTFRIGDLCHDPALSINQQDMGKALSDMMYMLHAIPYLPNLRRISVEYGNLAFDDIFDQYRFISFPTQVTNLEINYTLSPRMPSWLIGALRSKHERQVCLPWSLPSIRHLSVRGGGEALLADMISTCPNIRSLTTDAYIRLDSLAPLPNTVDRVILRESTTIPLSRGEMGGCNLASAWDGGAPTTPSKREIIIESKFPDLAVWNKQRIICGEHGVRPIHRVL